MADTPQGETAPSEPLSNEGNTPTTTAPAPVNVDDAEVERLRKEAEKKEQRIRQLENEAEARKKADEEARQKQLEEKEEYKTLYEQEKARLDEIQKERDAETRQKELATATETVFKDYPANVIEVAKTTGLGLSDDSEEATKALKEKLDTIQKQVGTVQPAGSNNHRETAPSNTDPQELVKKDKSGVSPMAMASAKGDDSVTREYISSLPAIKKMREQAGITE